MIMKVSYLFIFVKSRVILSVLNWLNMLFSSERSCFPLLILTSEFTIIVCFTSDNNINMVLVEVLKMLKNDFFICQS